MIIILLFSVILQAGFAQYEIEYPCVELDLDCIKDYFNNHAVNGCQALPSPKPEVLLIKYSKVFDALINSTVTRVNTTSPSALYGNITAFSVDRTNDITILTISYSNFIINVANATIAYFRSSLSPIYASVSDVSVLESLNITVYFYGVEKIYLADSLSIISAGGNLQSDTTPLDCNYNNPELAPVFETVSNNYGVYVRERLAPPQAFPYAAFFIQNNVCNFGISIPDVVV